MSNESVNIVDGLVDSKGAAEILGVSLTTFKVWGTRSMQGKPGLPSLLPDPAGQLSGKVYRVQDILNLKNELSMRSRRERTQQRKLGAYYTPSVAAELMAEWVMQGIPTRVLEPSAGEGIFIETIREVASKMQLKSPGFNICELDEAAARNIKNNILKEEDYLFVGDFLAQKELPRYDAIIANPPYIRIRELSKDLSESAHRAAESALDKSISKGASTWVPFVAKSVNSLENNGRAAFVLPSDFTYVNYAKILWKFLGEKFGQLTVIRSRQRIFPDILQNVIILLCDKKGLTTRNIEVISVEDISLIKDINNIKKNKIKISAIYSGERVFQKELLPENTQNFLNILENFSSESSKYIKFNIGYVSGNKDYFHPTQDDIEKFNIPQSSLVATVTTSRQLRNGVYTSSNDDKRYLWMPGEDLSDGEKLYISRGESLGVDMGYKCRIRSPWFMVPGVKTPDLMLTAFSDKPRLMLNDGKLAATNSILIGNMAEGRNPIDFIGSWYSPYTLLSYETQVHALGGGVMIAVPREADSVRVLNPEVVRNPDLSEIDNALKSGEVESAYTVGESHLKKIIGNEGINAIWDGYAKLGSWRKAG